MTDKRLSRGKRFDNGEWVIGYYCIVGYTNKQKYYIIPEYASAFYGMEVDPATAGQCTGIKDKNGKLIFEGDIIAIESLDLVGFIHWDERLCKYGLFYNNDGKCGAPTDKIPMLTYWIDNSENEAYKIIGNVHDNSELLEV